MTAGTSVVWSSVEPVGPVRLEPHGEPVAMEFAVEVLVIRACLVDTATQAVFSPDSGDRSLPLSWLHPRDVLLDPPDEPTDYVARGVLAPLANAVNEFYVLMEPCAGLFVSDRAGLLIGADLVGSPPLDASSVLDAALAAYGCAIRPQQPGRTWTLVDELVVPRFWLRPAGSSQEHFDGPRWAAAGYSREFIADLRTRMWPAVADESRLWAYVPSRAPDGAPQIASDDLEVCRDAAIVVAPSTDQMSIDTSATFYARVESLVAVHGDANVNFAFMREGSHAVEVFGPDQFAGQFALLADLSGVRYAAESVAAPTGSASAATESLVRVARTAPRAAMAPVRLYLLTGVWDNADLLEDWLEHHRDLGVAGVLAMDFGSTDGSNEILRSQQWSSLVEIMEFPGLVADHSRALADAARQRWSAGWALMIDPDEFLVTSSGDLRDPVLAGLMSAVDLLTIPRFDMTTVRSLAEDHRSARPDTADLDLRAVEQDQGKVAFDLAAAALPSLSAHDGFGRSSAHLRESDAGTCLLHAPVRSFREFERKVDHAATTLEANEHLDPGFAWHWRRWIDSRDTGRLLDEFRAQFVPDDDVPERISTGMLVRDERLRSAVRAARRRSEDRR